MPLRASINAQGLEDPNEVALFDNSERPDEEPIEFRFENHGQADPKGRFRFRLQGDTFAVDRATGASWADFTTLLQFNGRTLELEVTNGLNLSEAALDTLMDTLLLQLHRGSAPGRKFAQAVQTAMLT